MLKINIQTIANPDSANKTHIGHHSYSTSFIPKFPSDILVIYDAVPVFFPALDDFFSN